jgi:hypothetical protein
VTESLAACPFLASGKELLNLRTALRIEALSASSCAYVMHFKMIFDESFPMTNASG